ncbi:alpha-2-macroglobulin-like protein 1 [Discoglossus pictus]
MANEILELEVNGRKDQWPVTDKDGVAVFIISTTDTYTPNITMRVSYNNPDQCYYSPWNDYYDGPYAEHIAHRFYSKTGSFLDIQQTKGPLSCGKTHDIEVQYLLGSNGAEKATFYYQLISRKSIVLADKQEVDVAPSRLGSFNLGLPTIPLLHPYSYLLVYTFHEGETVVDTMVLNIEGCLNNQVTIGFSEEEAAPGDEVDLMFTATSESLCLLRVLDARVDNEYPYNILTPEQILYSFPTGNSYRYHVGDLDLEDPAPPCEDPQEQIFCQGGYYKQVSYWREGDAYGKLKDLGLNWITRLSYKKPEVCGMEEEENYRYHEELMFKTAAASGAVGPPSPASIVTVRDNFTDTLLYSVFSTDSEGNGRVSLTLPGSITKWDGSTVCLSNLEGIGITKEKAMLSSTLPYFVDITSSSMVMNGETMTLRVSVSNFLGKCVKSVITLASSSHYEAVLSSGELEQCVCSGDKAHVTYSITFMEAGAFNISVTAETTQISDTCVGPNDESQPSRRDTKIWIIFVEPEGIKTEVTTSQFICVQDTNSESQTSLTIAGDFVSGSETGHVTITPDVFGLVLSNIDDLLDMPYSCAEQNIARIQFILTVLNYLKCTNQLTDEKYKELQKKLSEGYGRQVGFYLHDGSYGVFRNSAPNTWVTVKTIKAFSEAKKHIFIDSKLVPQALIWLKNQQDPQTGCFRRSGYIFRTQNDAADDILLTIYTGISLMRSEDSLAQSILEGVKNCLRPLKIDDLSIYTTGYLFVFSALDENWDLWQVIYDHIIPLAIEEGPGHCWEFNNRADVETTSLMLYGLSMAPEIAEDQKAYLATISAWIISKMNSRGGFSTTQDTEMAIQALSALACRIGIPNTGYTVFIRKSGEELYKLDFNNQNWLMVPNYQLPDIPEDYTTEVMGSGCCLVQYTAEYNVPVSEENSAFSLSVHSSPESCNNGVAYSYMIHISVSYIGEGEPCTMAIVEVKLQSGYDLTYHSLHELESLKGVSKAEKKGNVVIVYLENVSELPGKNKTFPLHTAHILSYSVSCVSLHAVLLYIYSLYGHCELCILIPPLYSHSTSVFSFHLCILIPPLYSHSTSVFSFHLSDVFGLVLSNIDDLLDMPYSCAEQNIARIQFILIVLNYLKCRNQLTDEKYKELQKKLSEGYGRQVGFYLRDGSYGVFRNSAPNTWVTVKTIKAFFEAKKHIFIDSKLVPQALIWLKNQQDPQTGCFRRSGYIFRTQNDAEDDILLTIYTGISLMRSEDSLAQSILEGVKNCLRPLNIDDLSIYTTGYLFVFSALDENWDLWQVIHDHIIQLAIEEGPGHCWEFNNRADVETTSLMLYGLSMAPEIAEDQKAYLATISAWIISKMNSRGGFSTTQDTEMAIQALSALACRIGIPNTGYTVFIRKSGEELYKLDFNNQNWLQVPNYQLPDIPEDYTTEVMGSGCCLVQYTAEYNVPVSEENSAFSLSVHSSPESCNNGVAYSYMIHISVSYIGEGEPCTMAIVEVKLQSGYDLTYHSLHELESLKGVSKAEKKGNVVIVYLENVTSESVFISFKVNMGNRVSNLQDAIVRAYSYYNKEKNAAASYSHPCRGQAKGD